MIERTVNLKIEDVYPKLKTTLADKGCRVLSEESPKQISFKQGSLWGISPKTAKKTVDVNLETTDEGTRITCSTRLASDWKNITLIGCVFAFILAGLCAWMATDLTTFMFTHKLSFWSWLVTVRGSVDLVVGKVFVNLTWGLAGFLSVIILLEIGIVVYVRSRIDKFLQDALVQLS